VVFHRVPLGDGARKKGRGGGDADSWVPHVSDKEEGAQLSAKREKEGGARCRSAWAAACWAAGGEASRPERGKGWAAPGRGVERGGGKRTRPQGS